jgi:multicomponent Na+:H+ antiporter subunit F
MGAETVISAAAAIALFLMCAAFFLTAYRVIKGPTLPDRIVALDMLVAIAIGFIAVLAIRTGFNLYIDIAIALGLVGFLATVAFARFVLRQGMQADEAGAGNESPAQRGVRHGKAARTRRRR